MSVQAPADVVQPRHVTLPSGERMALRVHGGTGSSLVLIHGILGGSGDWSGVVERLAGFRIVVPDLLGFGDSSKPRDVDGLWADAQAAALDHALRELGIERAQGHHFAPPLTVDEIEQLLARDSGIEATAQR